MYIIIYNQSEAAELHVKLCCLWRTSSCGHHEDSSTGSVVIEEEHGVSWWSWSWYCDDHHESDLTHFKMPVSAWAKQLLFCLIFLYLTDNISKCIDY